MTHQYSKANPLLLFTDIATNLNRAKFKCKATQVRHAQKQKTRCGAAGFGLLVTLSGFKPETS